MADTAPLCPTTAGEDHCRGRDVVGVLNALITKLLNNMSMLYIHITPRSVFIKCSLLNSTFGLTSTRVIGDLAM